MAELVSKTVFNGKVMITILVSEQDLKFYPQYYGIASERRERQ